MRDKRDPSVLPGQDPKPGDPGSMEGNSFASRIARLFRGRGNENLSAPQEVEDIRRHFEFITQDHGFKEVRHRSDPDGSSVSWESAGAKIVVTISVFDGITVDLGRPVEQGALGNTSSAQAQDSTPVIRNVFDLREVLRLRDPQSLKELEGLSTSSKYERMLSKMAGLLKLHGQDFLSGDYSFFEELNKSYRAALSSGPELWTP